jgi:hypothetical protein
MLAEAQITSGSGTIFEPSTDERRNIAAQVVPGTVRRDRPHFFVTPAKEDKVAPLPEELRQTPSGGAGFLRTDLNREKIDPYERAGKAQTLQPVKVPTLPHPRTTFQTLRTWEGIVVSIGRLKFKAILSDLDDDSRGRESAEFYISEVSEDDQNRLHPGAVFYWYVGIEITRSHHLRTVQELRLRRLPMWSEREVKEVEAEAARLEGLFGHAEGTSKE